LYHFFNDFDTAPEIEREVRRHYQGPLALARDLMVFNVTPDEVRVRMAVTPDHVWPNKERHDAFRAAPRKPRPQMSRWLADQHLFPKFWSGEGASHDQTDPPPVADRGCIGAAVRSLWLGGKLSRASDPRDHSICGRRRCGDGDAPPRRTHGAHAWSEA